MNKIVLVILLITISSLIGIPQVQANKNIFNNFTRLYEVPNVPEAKLNTCKTCMAITSPASWNKYGLAIKSNPAFDRNNPVQAMKNIEPLDSDGDKFINIDEINNSTLPGDESDYPMVSSTQSSPNVPSTQIKTPEGTVPKSANTIINGFATIVIFTILYVFAKVRSK